MENTKVILGRITFNPEIMGQRLVFEQCALQSLWC